ncbi:uncharacterized protein LOC125178263 [Hyalella azteca]|uniref:Uncharacterized protein LOC125178263 n=1 Tax=Hyalella azteca TaxID=294128 RepID=A0A979FKQ0_HYAAZ|nr:uncharacterized protein LOC125178263 [Hyalella azteca]
MLTHAKPNVVVVDMDAAALRGAPWRALVAAARGVGVRLVLRPHDVYVPHDDLLQPLHGSGVRLMRFEGCVGPAGVPSLASCVARGAWLDIHMAAPLDLSALGGTYKGFWVYTRPLPPSGPSSPTWPLPPSPLPSLYVEGPDEGSWGAVAHTITSLAPHGKRFFVLALRGSRLSAAQLPPLLRALRGEGITTLDVGDTHAEVNRHSIFNIMDMYSITGLCVHPFVLLGTQCVHIILTEHYPWHDARSQCGLVGGDLIVFDDCEQYHKVSLYLAEQEYQDFWLGGSDEAEEGQWRWVDGSPMAMGLSYWANAVTGESEPNKPGVENCLELSCVWMYRFSNTLCSNVRRVICEADPI